MRISDNSRSIGRIQLRSGAVRPVSILLLGLLGAVLASFSASDGPPPAEFTGFPGGATETPTSSAGPSEPGSPVTAGGTSGNDVPRVTETEIGLTDEEISRIWQEELLRLEVRSAIEKQLAPRSDLERLWDLLNEPLALWLLSGVAIGSITFLYTRWESGRAEEKENRQLRRKLDLEIPARLRYSWNFLQEADDREDFLIALLILAMPSEFKVPIAVFPEYRDRSLRSLLWELQGLVPESERPELDTAYEAAQQIADWAADLASQTKRGDLAKDPVPADRAEELTELLQTRFSLDRWNLSFVQEIAARPSAAEAS